MVEVKVSSAFLLLFLPPLFLHHLKNYSLYELRPQTTPSIHSYVLSVFMLLFFFCLSTLLPFIPFCFNSWCSVSEAVNNRKFKANRRKAWGCDLASNSCFLFLLVVVYLIYVVFPILTPGCFCPTFGISTKCVSKPKLRKMFQWTEMVEFFKQMSNDQY